MNLRIRSDVLPAWLLLGLGGEVPHGLLEGADERALVPATAFGCYMYIPAQEGAEQISLLSTGGLRPQSLEATPLMRSEAIVYNF